MLLLTDQPIIKLEDWTIQQLLQYEDYEADQVDTAEGYTNRNGRARNLQQAIAESNTIAAALHSGDASGNRTSAKPQEPHPRSETMLRSPKIP